MHQHASFLEGLQHSSIAKRIGLDVGEVEELGDTRVGATQQLRIDLVADDLLLADRFEPASGEERHFERQAEQPLEPELARLTFEARHNICANAPAGIVGVDHERADLTKVLPHDVQRTTPDDLAINLCNDELLHRLVQRHELFAEQNALLNHWLEQVTDALDVCCARRANDDLTHGSYFMTLAVSIRCRLTEQNTDKTRTDPGFPESVRSENLD